MTKHVPFVSVIVATFNRPAALARCLDHLARSDYPPGRFEVIVVDDGGRADLSSVGAGADDGPEIRLVRQPNSGAAAARNRGASVARGDVLLFTDDDCLVSPGWMRALVDAVCESPDALVGGRTVNALDDNPFAAASQLLVNHLCAPAASGRRPLFVNGNNMAASRDGFVGAGRFDPAFRTSAGEDRELTGRFRQLGRPIVFRHDAVVAHANPLTWRTFLRQHANFGRAAYRLRAHRSPRTPPPPFGPPRFYLELITLPVDAGPRARWWGTVAVRGLLVAAQAATLAGFAAEWLSPRLHAGESSSGDAAAV